MDTNGYKDNVYDYLETNGIPAYRVEYNQTYWEDWSSQARKAHIKCATRQAMDQTSGMIGQFSIMNSLSWGSMMVTGVYILTSDAYLRSYLRWST